MNKLQRSIRSYLELGVASKTKGVRKSFATASAADEKNEHALANRNMYINSLAHDLCRPGMKNASSIINRNNSSRLDTEKRSKA
jgi:hypothetical protein